MTRSKNIAAYGDQCIEDTVSRKHGWDQRIANNWAVTLVVAYTSLTCSEMYMQVAEV